MLHVVNRLGDFSETDYSDFAAMLNGWPIISA
jgi:hypothetical protein